MAWLAACTAAALGALAATQAPSTALDWQPALAGTQPWRLITSAWVHLSTQHLQMNLGGCALVGLLGWRAELPTRATLAWALAWPLTHLGLLLQPALLHYGGLSGVLHAAVAIVACHLMWGSGVRRHRLIGALLAIGLVVKVLLEAPWSGAVRAVPGWDFALAPAAHANGVVAGVIAWRLVGRASRPTSAAGSQA